MIKSIEDRSIWRPATAPSAIRELQRIFKSIDPEAAGSPDANQFYYYVRGLNTVRRIGADPDNPKGVFALLLEETDILFGNVDGAYSIFASEALLKKYGLWSAELQIRAERER